MEEQLRSALQSGTTITQIQHCGEEYILKALSFKTIRYYGIIIVEDLFVAASASLVCFCLRVTMLRSTTPVSS